MIDTTKSGAHSMSIMTFCLMVCLQDKLREVSVAVFVVSSTGDGDAPENCERMVGAIQRKSWGPTFLSHLQYTVCGTPPSTTTTLSTSTARMCSEDTVL